MITKLCIKCGKIIPYPLSYCEEHQIIAKQNKSQSDKCYNRRIRNKRNDNFYHSKRWKALSAYVLLTADYKCDECGRIACEVHHIIDINTEWEKRFNLENLQPLCTRCHNMKRQSQCSEEEGILDGGWLKKF